MFVKSRGILQLALVPVIACALAGCVGTFGPSPSQLSTSNSKIASLTQDLKKRPNDVGTLRNLGQEYAGIGRWHESLGAYREALILNQKDREAVLGFARAQIATGDYAGALRHAELALASKADARALLLKGGALVGLNRLSEARVVLRQAVDMNPRDLDLRSDLALAEAMAKDPSAYGLARSAAFAPDADIRHMRNLVLVGGILGVTAEATRDAGLLGIPPEEAKAIIAIGTRARNEGMRAFGVAPLRRT